MFIRIDFADASRVSEEIDNLICKASNQIDRNENKAIKTFDKVGDILDNYLIENYFGGAENAVKYLGVEIYNEYFEFELMPN